VSRAEKWYAQIAGGQIKGWRFGQLKSILEWAEFEMAKGARGSHRTFRHAASGTRVTIPDKGSGYVKPVYVEKMAGAVARTKEEE